jgi:LacI family transcriptional regulator
MPHRFLVKEIARQAGVAPATVDRVLHARAHVREHTRNRVEQAIRDLERQETLLAMTGRKLTVDVVVEAPTRFAVEIRAALEAELPGLRPAVLLPRFDMRETMSTAQVVEALDAIGTRGSHGVLLKARDVPEVVSAIARLRAREVPVLTLFTDIPDSQRIAYAGLDNRVAGATAAYLVGQWVGSQPGSVLLTRSDERFRGEQQRELGFRQVLRQRSPRLRLVDASGGHGLDLPTGQRVRDALAGLDDLVAVYSMGGGNLAILRALSALGARPTCFIAHDLDQDNVQLLRDGRIQAVLHHELRQDLRSACQHLMCFHGLLPASAIGPCSQVVVVTPENVPAARWLRPL